MNTGTNTVASYTVSWGVNATNVQIHQLPGLSRPRPLTIGYGVSQPDPRIWAQQWPENAFVSVPIVAPRPAAR
jgi:hypothetical protein